MNLFELGLIIGSGGVLSHAPRRHQAALMMIDAFQPVGVTMLAVDSIFMMPQLGVLSARLPRLREPDFPPGLPHPAGPGGGPARPGEGRRGSDDGHADPRDGRADGSARARRPIAPPAPARRHESPPHRPAPPAAWTWARVAASRWSAPSTAAVVGVILDARGRPLLLPEDDDARRAKLLEWLLAVGALDA